MQPFAVIKWPEVCDFRRHWAAVGVSGDATELRKVALYANEPRLPMGAKIWEHMLSSTGKMEKLTLLWEISAHMLLYNRQMMFGKPRQKLSEFGVMHALTGIQSSCSWCDIWRPDAISLFLATVKKHNNNNKITPCFTSIKTLLW